MKKHYNNLFFESKINQSNYTSKVFFKILKQILGDLNSIIDVGCGTGSWLNNFHNFGVKDILGIDNYVDLRFLEISKDNFKRFNLSQPLDLEKKFDLALCLEVAEHLPESNSNTLIESLIKHSDFIVFSAAIPGQGGCNHVNEQWQDYWADKFSAQNYDVLDCFRPQIWNDNNIPFWFRQNTFLYFRKNCLISPNYNRSILNLVHPDLFAHSLTLSKTYEKSIIQKLLGLFK